MGLAGGLAANGGLSSSVAIVSSPNTFSLQNAFVNHTASTQPAGTAAAEVDLAPTSTTLAWRASHTPDWSSIDNNSHDLTNLYHKSTGDAIFAAHQGGQLPASFTFTATTNGTNQLSAVSSFTGLTVGTPITGTNIPAGTTITAMNVGASTLTISNAASDSVAGKTITVTRPAGTSGGNAIFNGLIPYNLDDTTTGRAGSILNNRDGMKGLFLQGQVTTNTAPLAHLQNWGAAGGLRIDNQNNTGGAPQGTGRAFQIEEYNASNSTILVNSYTQLTAGQGYAMIDLRAQWANSGSTASATAIQLVDATGAARFQLTTRGGIFINNASSQVGISLRSDTSTSTDGYAFLGRASTAQIGFYGATPIVRPSAVGAATGYAAGATVATFHSDDTYTGNVGTTAYTLNGIVAALKNLGLITS